MLEPCPFCGLQMTLDWGIISHADNVEASRLDCPLKYGAWVAACHLDAWNNRRTPSTSQSDEALVEIVREVAELQDRTSPDDWPEAMLVTAEELQAIVAPIIQREIAKAKAAQTRSRDVAELVAEENKRLRTIIRRERAAARREGIEEAAKVIQKRMDDRFEEHGTREPDTNATYYEGRAGETYEALDEEADDILTILRALAEKQHG